MAVSWIDFTLYRFLVGLGVGGMFGAATTLVAETVPGGFRPLALGSLQVLAAFGNMSGSLISLYIQPGAEQSLFGFAGWRVLFFVGILPPVLVVPIVFLLKEPQAWIEMRDASRQKKDAGASVRPFSLFKNKRWRRNTIVGLMLGLAGMVGLWGIGFFSPELISTALADEPQSRIDEVRAFGTASQDVGAFLGMLTFTFVASFLSRRLAFLGAFVAQFLHHGVRLQQSEFRGGCVLDAADDGLCPVQPVRRILDLLPRVVSDEAARRGRGLLLQHGALPGGAGADPAGLDEHDAVVPHRCGDHGRDLLVGAVALIWAPETKDRPLPEDRGDRSGIIEPDR